MKKTIFLLLISSMAFAANYPFGTITGANNGFHLDEASGATMAGISGATATVQGCAVNQASMDGFGKCISYANATDSLNMSIANVSTGNAAWSLGFWYKTTDTTETRTIFSGRVDNSGIYIYKVSRQFYCNCPGAWNTTVLSSVTSNAWTHVIFSYDGAGHASIYSNGALQETTNITAYGEADWSESRLGSNNNALIGLVDDPLVLNNYTTEAGAAAWYAGTAPSVSNKKRSIFIGNFQ